MIFEFEMQWYFRTDSEKFKWFLMREKRFWRLQKKTFKSVSLINN